MKISACELLQKKRFGGELNETEIREFVRGAVSGEMADYQVSAMLMAVCINGMTDRETLALTLAMAKSGETLHLDNIPGTKVDKHSTGGVGDTTTLVLAPLLAACGAKVAKMSGRGLGFTGGTLDKLESIPGMRTDISTADFQRIVTDVGCSVVGQSAELAPADKIFYALRDVTATVDSLPLITSSILSKKLASGCDAVILDVKTGSGALMDTEEKSMQLAQAMVRIGRLSGKRFSALITDMNQPLGNYIGNALEVQEAVGILSGKIDGDLKTVSIELGAHLLSSSRIAGSVMDGRSMLYRALESGEGLRRFAGMISAQGGDPRVTQDPSLLPQAAHSSDIRAASDGFISAIHTDRVGMAANALGAGRTRKDDVIDPAVGIILRKRLGEKVRRGEPVFTVKFNNSAKAASAMTMLDSAVEISSGKVQPPKLIRGFVE